MIPTIQQGQFGRYLSTGGSSSSGTVPFEDVFLRMPLNGGSPYDVSGYAHSFDDVSTLDIGTAGTYTNAGIKSAAAKFGAAGWRCATDEELTGRVLFWDNPSNITYSFGLKDFTIECWIKPGSVVLSSLSQRRISLIFDNAEDGRIDLTTLGKKVRALVKIIGSTTLTSATSGTIFGPTDETPGVYMLTSGDTTLDTLQWSHIAIQRLGTILEIFCDGVVVASCTINANFGNIKNMSIGGVYQPVSGTHSNVSTDIWPVYDDLDDVRIVVDNTAYTAPFDVPSAQLPIA